MSPVFSYMYILNIWFLQCFMRVHSSCFMSSCLDVSSLDACVQRHLFGRAHGWAKLIGHQLHFRQLVQARAWVKRAAWSHRISIDLYILIYSFIYTYIWYVNLRKKPADVRRFSVGWRRYEFIPTSPLRSLQSPRLTSDRFPVALATVTAWTPEAINKRTGVTWLLWNMMKHESLNETNGNNWNS